MGDSRAANARNLLFPTYIYLLSKADDVPPSQANPAFLLSLLLILDGDVVDRPVFVQGEGTLEVATGLAVNNVVAMLPGPTGQHLFHPEDRLAREIRKDNHGQGCSSDQEADGPVRHGDYSPGLVRISLYWTRG